MFDSYRGRFYRVTKLPRPGNVDPKATQAVLRRQVRDIGLDHGRPLRVQFDEHWTTDNMDMVRAHAAAVVASNPDIIVARGGRVVPVLMRLSRSIPMVVPGGSDPVGVGWAQSLARPGGGVFIIGVDLVKDRAVLHAAYNDAAGVTAKFNLNILARINRELGANFHPKCFEHHAFFNRERSRIEMHLASIKCQKVKIRGETIQFRSGETIHTENSYKYTLKSFGALARGSGCTVRASWTDPNKYFAVYALMYGAEASKARP